MADETRSGAELITAFLEETTTAFKPWVESGRGTSSTSLMRMTTSGDLEPTTPAAVSGLFFAKGELQTKAIVAEISYGDRELLINAIATPRSRSLQHGLWEWADAAGYPKLVPHDTALVNQLDRLRSIVREMGLALRTLEPIIATPPKDVLDRLAARRTAFYTAQDTERRERDHQHAVAKANEAFRKHEWKQVIALLTPVEDRLSPAETAKLRYARRELR
jgi:hypothetical protein